jgi:hypothetical protein
MLAKTPLRDQMIAWLEEKDPNSHYNWDSPVTCACAQFAAAVGREDEWKALVLGHQLDEWGNLNVIARGADARGADGWREWTFGALLERLRA